MLIIGDAGVTYKDWDLDVVLDVSMEYDAETRALSIDTPGGQGTIYIPKETICTLFQMCLNQEI